MSELSDREIDVLVAEKVMEWKRVHSDRDVGDDRKSIAWMNHHSAGILKGEPYTHPSMNDLYDRTFAKWSPSTNISAAMEVVEKMRGLGYSFACTLYEGKLPYASFCKLTAASSRNAEAETLPRAICEAAIAALSTVGEK